MKTINKNLADYIAKQTQQTLESHFNFIERNIDEDPKPTIEHLRGLAETTVGYLYCHLSGKKEYPRPYWCLVFDKDSYQQFYKACDYCKRKGNPYPRDCKEAWKARQLLRKATTQTFFDEANRIRDIGNKANHNNVELAERDLKREAKQQWDAYQYILDVVDKKTRNPQQNQKPKRRPADPAANTTGKPSVPSQPVRKAPVRPTSNETGAAKPGARSGNQHQKPPRTSNSHEGKPSNSSNSNGSASNSKGNQKKPDNRSGAFSVIKWICIAAAVIVAAYITELFIGDPLLISHNSVESISPYIAVEEYDTPFKITPDILPESHSDADLSFSSGYENVVIDDDGSITINKVKREKGEDIPSYTVKMNSRNGVGQYATIFVDDHFTENEVMQPILSDGSVLLLTGYTEAQQGQEKIYGAFKLAEGDVDFNIQKIKIQYRSDDNAKWKTIIKDYEKEYKQEVKLDQLYAFHCSLEAPSTIKEMRIMVKTDKQYGEIREDHALSSESK